jgi:hypothetical protein
MLDGGFEDAEVDRSLLAASLAEKPKLSGDGSGVVERFCSPPPGCAWFCEGRVPIGATLAVGVCLAPWRGGDPPVGDEVDVRLDCVLSNRLNEVLGFEDGDEVLFARDL